MSSTITVSWTPLDEGVSREAWAAFCADARMTLELSTATHYLRGDDQDWHVEASCQHGRNGYASFRTGGGGGVTEAARLALRLWSRHGGHLSAPPEITGLIRIRFLGISQLADAVAQDSWSRIQAALNDIEETEGYVS